MTHGPEWAEALRNDVNRREASTSHDAPLGNTGKQGVARAKDSGNEPIKTSIRPAQKQHAQANPKIAPEAVQQRGQACSSPGVETTTHTLVTGAQLLATALRDEGLEPQQLQCLDELVQGIAQYYESPLDIASPSQAGSLANTKDRAAAAHTGDVELCADDAHISSSSMTSDNCSAVSSPCSPMSPKMPLDSDVSMPQQNLMQVDRSPLKAVGPASDSALLGDEGSQVMPNQMEEKQSCLNCNTEGRPSIKTGADSAIGNKQNRVREFTMPNSRDEICESHHAQNDVGSGLAGAMSSTPNLGQDRGPGEDSMIVEAKTNPNVIQGEVESLRNGRDQGGAIKSKLEQQHFRSHKDERTDTLANKQDLMGYNLSTARTSNGSDMDARMLALRRVFRKLAKGSVVLSDGILAQLCANWDNGHLSVKVPLNIREIFDKAFVGPTHLGISESTFCCALAEALPKQQDVFNCIIECWRCVASDNA